MVLCNTPNVNLYVTKKKKKKKKKITNWSLFYGSFLKYAS